MKKKLLKILTFSFILVLWTACGNKKKEKVDVDLEFKEGKIVITCTSDTLGTSDIKITSTTTANFDKDLNIVEYKQKEEEIDKTLEVFESRKESYEKRKKAFNEGNTEYKYVADIENYRYVGVSITKLDSTKLTDEEKERYEIKNYVKSHEKNGYKCTLKGITREKLGL